MRVPDLFVGRPVFTTMLVALPVVLGLVALGAMNVSLYPEAEIPFVTVTVSRPGSSAEEMETSVTKEVEEAVNEVSGIQDLRSTTTEGLSVTSVQFVLEKGRDVAHQEVQGKVNGILAKLPPGTDTPVVEKFDANATPVLTIAMSSPSLGLRELTELADKRVADDLSSLPGVGRVNVIGGRTRAVQVAVDVAKLEAYRLSVEQVRAALAAQNLELPGGRVDQGRRELVLRTMGRVADPAGFGEVIVADVEGRPVRVRDLGTVTDGEEEPRTLARLSGKQAVSLIVVKQGGANTIAVVDAVRARLAELQASFAAEGRSDLKVEVIRDQSTFIRASLHEVEVHLVLGAVLVVLTILLFLRDWRSTVIAAVAIPASLVSAFPVMWAFGLTLDNLTLLALVLVIGIVIDDAVIVIENVFRWMEERGVGPLEAAVGGTREILLAVVATTLSLAVIFIPIAMMSGLVGRFLKAFGLTCAVAIMVSLFVSLTLTPMLSAKFLRKPKHAHGGNGGGLYGRLVERPYMALLRASMRRRWTVVALTALSMASMFPLPGTPYPGLAGLVGFDFVPKDDQSQFTVDFRTPEGWTLARAGEAAADVERRLLAMSEVTAVLTQVGDRTGRQAEGEGPVTNGQLWVKLKDLGSRDPDFAQADVASGVRAMLKREYPDLRTSVALPAEVEGLAVNYDQEFLLVGPDLDRLRGYADRVVATLRANPGLADVDTNVQDPKPELRVHVDRERASDLGVDVRTIASTLRAFVGGEIVSDFKNAPTGERYDVWLRAAAADRGGPEAVAALTVPAGPNGPNGGGSLVRLASVATAAEAVGPAQIERAARRRAIPVVANHNGLASGDAVEAFRRAFADLGAPPEYQLLTTGNAREQEQSNRAFVVAFGMSFLLMYMILAAQFESFLHPVAILLSIPLTIPFAFVSLLIFGSDMSLFSLLGLFLLFGIVKKNGILQVDYANVLRARAAADPSVVPPHLGGGKRWAAWALCLPDERRARLWAILEANRARLRPILMTTLMLVAAMVPVALGQGPGAANRADMAKVIIGGQALSLLLSLLVTPVAYSMLDDLALAARRWRAGRAVAVATARAPHHPPVLPTLGDPT